MFNVIDNRLRSIKHIQNIFFGGVNVIMIGDFYQTPPVKDSWMFQNVKKNINTLTPIFWQTYVQCYKLNKVMKQFDMVFIQTLNKFHTITKNTKDIEFINSICNQQPPNDFTIPYLFYKNKTCAKNSENVFTNTLGPTFILKAMDINHQSCPPSYKHSNDFCKIFGLHSTINIIIYILVELCVSNYATSDDLANGFDCIFKASTTYCEKNYIHNV